MAASTLTRTLALALTLTLTVILIHNPSPNPNPSPSPSPNPNPDPNQTEPYLRRPQRWGPRASCRDRQILDAPTLTPTPTLTLHLFQSIFPSVSDNVVLEGVGSDTGHA